MARIRTVKPDLSRHEGLYQLEQSTGLPIRFAWAMLPTACDKEGRFRWRPNVLKLDILPFDDCDFSRVLDAWVTRGQVVKYRVGDAWFGCIPTWRKHQVINNKERDSEYPSLDEADEVINHRKQPHPNACTTREAREDNAKAGTLLLSEGEGEGEGEGKGKDSFGGKPPTPPKSPRKPDLIFEAIAKACGIDWKALTKNERGALNNAASQLKALNVTPEDIQARAAKYRQKWPTIDITPMALVNNWNTVIAQAAAEPKLKLKLLRDAG